MIKSTPGSSWSKSMPINIWPAPDREAWQHALQPGDAFDPGGAASRWSAASRRKTELGYGRFLFFILQRGELDPAALPTTRITPERLADYLSELRQTVRGHTIQCRIQELGDALRAIAPEGDWRYILRAAARLRASTIPAIDKRARLRPVEELISDGFKLRDEADGSHRLSALGRAVEFRDGLVLAFLGFHPLRLRNLAELEIDRHIIDRGAQFILQVAETKGGQSYEAPIAARLTDRVRRYLHQHRPILLKARGRWFAAPGNALWISRHGSACSEDTFENIVRKRTSGRNRLSLSPHLFRSCAATSIAVKAPGSVDIIPAVLAHGSPKPGERYYNLASSLEASRAHNSVIDGLRRDFGRQLGNAGSQRYTSSRRHHQQHLSGQHRPAGRSQGKP